MIVDVSSVKLIVRSSLKTGPLLKDITQFTEGIAVYTEEKRKICMLACETAEI